MTDLTPDRKLYLLCGDDWRTTAEIQEFFGIDHRRASAGFVRAVTNGNAWRRMNPNGHWEYRIKPNVVDRLRQTQSSKINTLGIA